MKTCFWKGSYSSLRERPSIPEKFNVMVVEVNLDRVSTLYNSFFTWNLKSQNIKSRTKFSHSFNYSIQAGKLISFNLF